ncbi:MAG: cytochrome C [Candidatus Nitricoxidivorans perseverans]|uniref:Cytochrome C n=1 Tax=Candidatus Nitricoxidivorans perseverans TaxID=2975601 RepID=A0AA49FJ18_9PROT|nr:MAG: cytochrome C [Candidatus Nitricoxidivorans perseverans]
MARNAWSMLAGLWVAGLLLSGGAAATTMGDTATVAPAVQPAAIANHRCLRCHADQEDKFVVRRDGTRNDIYIDPKVLEHSVHGKMSCTGCHSDVTKLPHAKPLAGSVGCVGCHQQKWEAAQKESDPKKRARLDVVIQQTENYLHSAHARPNVKDQSRVNAACHDCHDAHNIGAPGAMQRKEHRLKNHEVCGRCHEKQKTDYLGSIHGKAVVDKKDEKSAVCSDCHTTHDIGSPKTDPMKLAITKNCGDCHKDAQKTYLMSYHGQVNRLGYTNTAKCFDCHGGHKIQKDDDPTSAVHVNNRLKNCKNCHKNATDNFLAFQPHGDPDNIKKYPGLYWSKRFMQALILGVMVFFWVHVLLWLYRESMDRIRGKGFREDLDRPETVYFRRFSPVWRWIHALFAIATMVLILTGTTLLFSHTDWAKAVIVLLGGPKMEGIIHRTAAVTWLSIFFIHLAIACTNIWRNRKTFQWFGGTSMLPSWNDLRDLKNMFKWFLGRAERPEFCHWTYWQKFDYWAPFWGATIIGSSGLILFFPEKTAAILPGWVFNIATLVHAEEAVLAAIFLNTVHFFNVHFRPERFPMSTTIFTGAIPLEEFKHDHRLEYERLVAIGELEKHLVKRPSRRVDLAASFLATVLIIAGLTLLTLVLIGRATH